MPLVYPVNVRLSVTDQENELPHLVMRENRYPHIMMEETVPTSYLITSLVVTKYRTVGEVIIVYLLLNGDTTIKIRVVGVKLNYKVDLLLRFGSTRWRLAIEKPYERGVERVYAYRRHFPGHEALWRECRNRMFLGLHANRAGSNRYHHNYTHDNGYISDEFNDHDMMQSLNNTEHPL